MPPVGSEPTISAGGWPQTYTLDRADTGIGHKQWFKSENSKSDNVTLSFGTAGHYVFKTTCSNVSQSSPQIWRLENKRKKS